jgi:RNA polymerase sigma factor (TIGR02999 family)
VSPKAPRTQLATASRLKRIPKIAPGRIQAIAFSVSSLPEPGGSGSILRHGNPILVAIATFAYIASPRARPLPSEMSDITLALQSVGRGDPLSSHELLSLVYEQLRRLAAARMAREAPGQTLQATALVHEAWLRLVKDDNQVFENRAHFFSAASEAMRRIVIENARRKASLKRGGAFQRVDISEITLADTTPDDKILMIDEALESLQAEHPEIAQLVVMKIFGGLTNEEASEALDISERTAGRQWAFAKAWLLDWIQQAY